MYLVHQPLNLHALLFHHYQGHLLWRWPCKGFYHELPLIETRCGGLILLTPQDCAAILVQVGRLVSLVSSSCSWSRPLRFRALHSLQLIWKVVAGYNLLIMGYGGSSSRFLPPLSHLARPLIPESKVGAHFDILGGGATTAVFEDDLATHGSFLFHIIIIIIGGGI